MDGSQAVMLRASRHLEIADDGQGSARAWLLITARDVIIERGAS